jgi:hypothetical protein
MKDIKEIYEAMEHWAATTPLDDFVFIILLVVVGVVSLFWMFRLLFSRRYP